MKTLASISHIILSFLLYPYANCLAQSTITKSINDPATRDFGFGLIRHDNDSVLFLSIIDDLNSNTQGFYLNQTDLSLNIVKSTKFSSSYIGAYNLNDLNDDTFLINGQRRDTVGNDLKRGISAVRVNSSGDTLWSRSYIPTDSIKGITLQYAGQFNDTLIFFGDIAFNDIFYSLQGFLLYIHRQNGNIIMAKTYSDSLYTGNFRLGIVDTALQIIHLTGDRFAKDGSGLSQIFYTALDNGGNPIQGYMLSDSSNASNGCLLKVETDHSIIVGYRTQKNKIVLNGADYELIKIDSTGNVVNCRYNPNPSFGNLPIQSIEFMSSTNTIRLWAENYYIELDTGFNYVNGKWLQKPFPSYKYGCDAWRSFPDCILGLGYKIDSQFSTPDLLLVKTNPNGDNCYSMNFSAPLNFITRTLNESTFMYQASAYNNISEVYLPLFITQNTLVDSVYCTTQTETITSIQKPVIYPNPVNDAAELRGLSPGQNQLIIRDVSGRICFSGSVSVNHPFEEIELPVESLSSGSFYVLTIKSEDNSLLTLKFVK